MTQDGGRAGGMMGDQRLWHHVTVTPGVTGPDGSTALRIELAVTTDTDRLSWTATVPVALPRSDRPASVGTPTAAGAADAGPLVMEHRAVPGRPGDTRPVTPAETGYVRSEQSLLDDLVRSGDSSVFYVLERIFQQQVLGLGPV